MTSAEDDVREQVHSEISDDLFVRLAEKLGATASAAAVFGSPVEQDGVKVIPVAKARWGIGGGSGRNRKKDERGAGIGAGVQTLPVGYIEFTPTGVEYRRIHDPLRYLPALIVMPFAVALSAALAMAAAAAIAGTAARRTMAAVSEMRVPFPRLTFRG